MNKNIKFASAVVCIFGGLTALPASAAVVSSISGGIVHSMPAIDYFGGGPQVFGPGITWSSTNLSNQGGSVFGYTGGYGFAGNGYWDGGLGPMAGLNDSTDAYGVTDTMTFAFSSPVSAVGGFINYVPGSANPTVLAVYDSGMNLIESYSTNVFISSNTNDGLFVGFDIGVSNISYFTLTDNYVGITDLTTPVPEPETYAMLLAGLGLLGFMARRSKGATV